MGIDETVTPELVEKYLKQLKRRFKRIDETTWLLTYRGEVNSFRLFVRLIRSWILFTIYPFVMSPESPEARLRLYAHLLGLNHHMNLAKFSLDEDSEVVLMVEFPTENLDYSEFKDALDILSYYSDKFYLDVLNLAQNKQTAEI